MSIKTDWVMCVHDKRVVDCKPCYDMTQVAVDPWREMVRTLRARVSELDGDVALLKTDKVRLKEENAAYLAGYNHAAEWGRDMGFAIKDALWRIDGFSAEDLRGVEEAVQVLSDALQKGNTQ